MIGADGGEPRPDGSEAVLVLGEGNAADPLPELRRRLPALLDSGPDTLVLDLSRTSALSSATVAAILWINRRCRARGTEVVLRRPSRRGSELLRSCGLGDTVLVDPDGLGGDGRQVNSLRGRPG
jgi:anti-anti-sigma regulatory factor